MLHLPARRGRAVIDGPGITLLTSTISTVVLASQHIFLFIAAVSAAAFLAALHIREVPLRSQRATSPPSRNDHLPATPALDSAARPA
jgi:hypothetical protein